MDSNLVLLCADGHSSRVVYSALRARHGDFPVIMEQSISRLGMAKRRVKRLGLVKALGQMAFAALVVPVLHRLSKERLAEIERQFGFEDTWGSASITKVESVNADDTREALKILQPNVVIVNGTRIIGTKTLECVDAPFINMHAGITPLYRGVHGGYWALVEDRKDLVGTTVHLVDKGIDTGNVIQQATFVPTTKDNFATYPYLHTAAGLPLLIEAIESALSQHLMTTNNPKGLESRLRYHPTIFEYLRNRITRGVR